MLKQKTLGGSFSLKGKGLHTGVNLTVTFNPAPDNHGYKIQRIDLEGQPIIDAVAENVGETTRGTVLVKNDIKVSTIEHGMAALYSAGIDNCLIQVDGPEFPILDGSAKPYIDAIWKDGVDVQDEPRKYIEIKETIEVTNEKGAIVRIEPAEEFSYNIKTDFNSRILGVQHAQWDPSVVYAEEIGVCRTFVFFHELQFLFANNLVKGGDVDNAIVVVEHPVTDEQVQQMSQLFNVPALEVREDGYLSNLVLRFPNECSRHKLLDLIGDLRLAGGFLKAKVTAEKAGHGINTTAARRIRESLV